MWIWFIKYYHYIYKGGFDMSYFALCIIGIIIAVLVGIWRANMFSGALRVFFIIGAIIAVLFFLLCAIALYN